MTATPGHSCLELHASLGVSPCPQQRWALSPCLVGRDGHCRAPAGMRAAVSFVSGWLCGLLTGQAAPLLPQPVNLQAVGRAVSQGQVSSVLGSPGAADLSPQFRTVCFSSRTLCVWPGHKVVSLAPVRSSLVTLSHHSGDLGIHLSAGQMPTGHWLRWDKASSISLWGGLHRGSRCGFESRLSVDLGH